MDWIIDKIILPLLLFLAVILIIGVFYLTGWVIYHDATASTFELAKADWSCTATKTDSTTIFVQSGKALVPVTTAAETCVNWVKK